MCIRDSSIPFLFFTFVSRYAFVNIMLVLALRAANYSTWSACDKSFGTMPVSYTHLDVYKRQLQRRPCRRDLCFAGADAGRNPALLLSAPAAARARRVYLSLIHI